MRPFALLALLAASAGCSPTLDADQDGFSAEVDCDDNDPSINPIAAERCDGIDQDCDGSIDEFALDVTIFYTDLDLDGIGSGSGVGFCDAPGAGWSVERGDCDDQDPAVYPGAEERCDGFDQNCDGAIDEGFVCGEIQCDDGLDDDEDGRIDCDDPDCDGACPETCEDGRDNDGNGATDCADSACWTRPSCVETDCFNGVDDEADGLADCDDPDCWGDACPEAVWRITSGSASASRETTVWTERDCSGPCDSGVDRVQEVQTYDVTGELVRVRDGADVRCAWSYTAGRFYSEFLAGQPTERRTTRTNFKIEPGCGVSDARFLPTTLLVSGDGLRSPDGRSWIRGDRFEASSRVSDLDDPERTGQITRDIAFWDPIRTPEVPRGRCPEGPGQVRFDDADSDGFGAANVGRLVCTDTTGVETSGDCDDDRDSLPAAVEICGNGLDDDCNGTAPSCDGPSGEMRVGAAGESLWRTPDAPSLPRVFPLGDLDDDGLGEVAIAMPTAASISGPDSGSIVIVDATGATRRSLYGTSPGDVAGAWVGSLGDQTGDGHVEVLITATGTENEGVRRSGTAYVVSAFGEDGSLDSRALGRIDGRGDWLGTSAAILGDLDDDGITDIAIGSQTDPTGGTNAGSVRVFQGPLDADLIPSDASSVWLGNRNDIVGDAVAGPGDVDGDGRADLLVGRRKAGVDEAGAAHLLLSTPASALLDDADVTWTGDLADAWAGERVGAAGDLDDDGYRDLIVSAPRTWGVNPRPLAATGQIYIFYGAPDLSDGRLEDADAVIRGDRIYDLAGASVSGGGDVDGDGLDDLLLGAPGDDRGGAQGGVVALFHGPVRGRLRIADADARIRGENGWQIGTWSCLHSDLDGDGYADLVTSGLLPNDADDSIGAGVFTVWGGPGW